jgi:hypothetical protein
MPPETVLFGCRIAVFSGILNKCRLEYLFEASPEVLTGGQIRPVTVSKTLLGGAAGEFTIELAPGGPLGVEDPTTWTQLLTPMSHVLVGMSRGADAAVVMDGIVVAPGEDQSWTTQDQGSSASRDMAISAGSSRNLIIMPFLSKV